MKKATFIILAIASVLLAVFCCSVAEAAFPYTVINIDTLDRGQQFTTDRQYFGSTPFFKFVVTEDDEPFDLTGWTFALSYGYDREASALVSFSGTNYVTVTNNEILINGSTNFFFEPYEGYYVGLQGTYSEGGYSSTFAEGTMDVYYTPSGDPNVPTLENGITFDIVSIETFAAFTNAQNTVDTNQNALISDLTTTQAVHSAEITALNSAIDLKQDAATAATDTELIATNDLLQTAIDLKLDAVSGVAATFEAGVEFTGSVGGTNRTAFLTWDFTNNVFSVEVTDD